MHIELDAGWRIVEFQACETGQVLAVDEAQSLEGEAVVDKTFRAGERFAGVHTEVKEPPVPLRRRHRGPLHGRGDL